MMTGKIHVGPGRANLTRIWLMTVMLVVVMGAASGEAAAQMLNLSDAISGDVGVELRGFPSDALFAGQDRHAASLAADMEWFQDFGRGKHRILVNPFLRLDAGDSHRTHFDLREAYWQFIGSRYEVKTGFSKVFWGVTESNHLVDIINQTDNVESPDGEDKLGQPMIQSTWIFGRGTLDVFVLPFFRERTFPGAAGRLRTPFLPPKGDWLKQDRVDVGARMFLFVRSVDIGVSGFHGSSREPLFEFDSSGDFDLSYPAISQVGLDVLWIKGAWIFKSETIYRSGYLDDFVASTSGFEYTFSNIKNTGWDIGGLAEYHHDGRAKVNFQGTDFRLSSLERDVFGGLRLALNDVQSSELLFGAIVDTKSKERFLFMEASRRLSDRFKAQVEARIFQNTSPDGFIYFLREDSFAQFTLTYFY